MELMKIKSLIYKLSEALKFNMLICNKESTLEDEFIYVKNVLRGPRWLSWLSLN